MFFLPVQLLFGNTILDLMFGNMVGIGEELDNFFNETALNHKSLSEGIFTLDAL